MSNLQTTADLKRDILRRAGEPVSGNSDYDAQALDYLNRAVNTLALGGGEFTDESQDDWWWLRQDPPGVLVLQPPFNTGSVLVTNNLEMIVFSNPPTFSAVGWHFRVDELDTTFRVIAHVAGEPTATLDTVYTGLTNTMALFTLFKLTYALATNVLRVVAPMRGYHTSRFDIDGTEAAALERDWPIAIAQEGVPDRFAHVTETKVRFNRYGITTDGGLLRIEYDYLFKPPELINAPNEEPAVPARYRYLLADMALFMLFLDKDDNRDGKLAEIAKRGIDAMKREHKHRMTTTSRSLGKIYPRQSNLNRQRVRTASGFIIR